MRRLSAILLLLLTSALCAAQSPADVLQAPGAAQPQLVDQLLHSPRNTPSALSNLQATPLWGTPDGRILAIVAFADSSVPAKPQAPQIGSATDWKFVDVTNFVTSGLLLNLNRDTAAYATFGRGVLLGPTYPATWSCGPVVVPDASGAACGERASSRTVARCSSSRLVGTRQSRSRPQLRHGSVPPRLRPRRADPAGSRSLCRGRQLGVSDAADSGL
jgi:hypothetical protein